MNNFNKMFNYFEDDTFAADWFNHICARIAWKAFRDQEDWIYMAGELGEGRKPKVKDNFFEVFDKLFDNEMAWMKSIVLFGFLKMYYDENIDVSKELAAEWNDFEELEPGDKDYMEGRDD